MVKNNEWVIPKNIEKQVIVEEVRELVETPWWQEYQSQVNKSSLSPAARGKVISKSGDGFVSERGGEGYGPMPSESDAIMMVAGSQMIMSKVRRDFPNVARLLEWNQNLTLGFLQRRGALSLYQGTDAFRVPCSHENDYSKTGTEAWKEYRRKIDEYVTNICSKGEAGKHLEELEAARGALVEYIHEEYYKVLPLWPDVGETNSRSFKANISGAYNYGSTSQVVWSCLGWINVEDKRPTYDTFTASFGGSPEIKVLILNLNKLRQIEDMCVNRGIEDAKNHIRNERPTYQLTWSDL